MANIPDSPMGQMYHEHIGFILAKDVDGLLNQYSEDCVLISTLTPDKQPLYIRGHKELEAFFRERIFSLEKLETSINQWAETENLLMMVEEIKTFGLDGSEGTVEFYDNWWLEGGKIKIHFAGTIRYPDGSYADATDPKSDPPDTPLGRLYRKHLDFIHHKNVEGILGQYSPDALLIGTLTDGRKPHFVRGREELRSFFNGNFMGLKSLESKIDQWAEIENGLMIVESIKFEGMDGSKAEMSFYDNWVLQDGQIIMHYAGVVRYPDGSYA
jgi:hypothetical protein